MTSPTETLRAQWIAEMEEFLRMTLAASRGLKHSGGGRLERDDAEAYDEEASGCGAALLVLKTLALPEDATPEQARSLAIEALSERAETIQQRCARTPFEWARAVVEGDASRFWNAYHPRRAR